MADEFEVQLWVSDHKQNFIEVRHSHCDKVMSLSLSKHGRAMLVCRGCGRHIRFNKQKD